MSKLDELLSKSKIDPRRVLAASKKVEALRDEDRSIKLAKKRAKAGKATDAEKERATEKGRSGKAVTPPMLRKAREGAKLSGPGKQRILRAVNHVLTTKKSEPVTLADLF